MLHGDQAPSMRAGGGGPGRAAVCGARIRGLARRGPAVPERGGPPSAAEKLGALTTHGNHQYHHHAPPCWAPASPSHARPDRCTLLACATSHTQPSCLPVSAVSQKGSPSPPHAHTAHSDNCRPQVAHPPAGGLASPSPHSPTKAPLARPGPRTRLAVTCAAGGAARLLARLRRRWQEASEGKELFQIQKTRPLAAAPPSGLSSAQGLPTPPRAGRGCRCGGHASRERKLPLWHSGAGAAAVAGRAVCPRRRLARVASPPSHAAVNGELGASPAVSTLCRMCMPVAHTCLGCCAGTMTAGGALCVRPARLRRVRMRPEMPGVLTDCSPVSTRHAACMTEVLRSCAFAFGSWQSHGPSRPTDSSPPVCVRNPRRRPSWQQQSSRTLSASCLCSRLISRTCMGRTCRSSR